MTAKSPLVLIVDDDPDLLELTTLAFEQDGRRVMTARSGIEALDLVERAMPDLILLDMRMPIMNGWQFAREFRARYGRKVPIVVLTAAEDAGRLSDEVAADGYISKPFGLADLLRTAGKALASHR